REDDEVVDLALVLWLHPLVGIEAGVGTVAARHHAGDLARQIGDVEGLDLPRAARAAQDSLPGRLDAASERRHHTEACDDNPPHACNSSPDGAACNKKPARRICTVWPALSLPRKGVSFWRSFQGTWWRRRRSESSPQRRREFRNRILLQMPSRARPCRGCQRRGRQ